MAVLVCLNEWSSEVLESDFFWFSFDPPVFHLSNFFTKVAIVDPLWTEAFTDAGPLGSFGVFNVGIVLDCSVSFGDLANVDVPVGVERLVIFSIVCIYFCTLCILMLGFGGDDLVLVGWDLWEDLGVLRK